MRYPALQWGRTMGTTASAEQTELLVTRREARGRQGMVTAKHPLVADLGLQVLREGGNAVDAAVAMAFAIGVVEPHMSGLGGGGFMSIHLRDGRNLVVDYFARAPLAARPDMYELTSAFRADRLGFTGVKENANTVGPRSIAVPGLVSGLTVARDRFGSLPLARLVQPAIQLAERGYPVTWHTTLMQATSTHLLRRFAATAQTFLDDGLPFAPGADAPLLLRQPDLAATLRRVAEEGAAGFYRGPVAASIALEMGRSGGLVSEQDLEGYEAKVVDAAIGAYNGYELVAIPGASGGTTLLECFNILEGYSLAALGHNSVPMLHRLIEAARRGHADRLAYLGDPEQVSVPWDTLVSKAYATERRSKIDPDRSTLARPGEPASFAPGGVHHDITVPAAEGDGGCTTHLSVIDAAGNVVAVTQTLTSLWGSGVTAAGAGVLLNNTMNLFNPQPGLANSIAPWTRPASSVAHFIVLRDGEPVLVTGAPGGRRIMDTVLQVTLNVLDFGMGIQEAVSAPLIDATGPETYIDPRIPESVRAQLSAMGHELDVRAREFYPGHYARPAGIARNRQTGELHGGADPYDVGVAAGY